MLERVAYSPYGVARHQWPADASGDGAVNSADLSIVLSSYGSITGTAYRSEADFNRDGDVDAADLAAVLSYAAALPEGTLSSPGIANRTGYCGYRFAPETEMYLARNRWLSPPLGRWIERDPLGYVDGMGLYEYVRSGSVDATDPWGLRSGPPFWGQGPGWDHEGDMDALGVPWFLANYLPVDWLMGSRLPVWMLQQEHMEILLRKYSQQHVARVKSVAVRELSDRLRGGGLAFCSWLKRFAPDGSPAFGGAIDLEFPLPTDSQGGAVDRLAEYWWSPLTGHLVREPGAWTQVLNQWSYSARAKCKASVMLTCCEDGRVRIRGSATCELDYRLSDTFDNPLDIGGAFATGSNVLGRAYLFTGAWKHRWRFEFASGSANCDCGGS